ncbi:uncharacterized protein BJ171DRAFT_472875 [Polychytrium aggregatum]|uniref:uncharacterized protein n=1 Tax=Polychytrium aggregatum TaxID=110093 RepID=UPI0022FE7D51|nr:uncharacterized protein BJ171DRAFT_472875 [Polychytrium aggregatum]KAI9206880.1 hypothetical protein BJ171DRAFT_472875 [Polychytrium aggregatum]
MDCEHPDERSHRISSNPTEPLLSSASGASAGSAKLKSSHLGSSAASRGSVHLPPLHGSLSDATLKDIARARKRIRGSTHAGDSELLSSMSRYTLLLETKVRHWIEESARKDIEICKLKKQLGLAEFHTESGSEVNALRRECIQLQEKVSEMETFLLKYNMIWNAELPFGKRLDRVSSKHAAIPKPSQLTAKSPFPYNLANLMTQIEQLNRIAAVSRTKIRLEALRTNQVIREKNTNLHLLKTPDPLSLTLYQNGFVLEGGSFRPYTDQAAAMFMCDLMDGYFPYELKDTYPDGVPFKIIDRHTIWRPLRIDEGFPPVGLPAQKSTLAGATLDPDALDRPALPSDTAWSPDISLEPASITTERFLQKLPKCIVQGGSIINIRGDVEALLRPKDAECGISGQQDYIVQTKCNATLQSVYELLKPYIDPKATTTQSESQTAWNLKPALHRGPMPKPTATLEVGFAA